MREANNKKKKLDSDGPILALGAIFVYLITGLFLAVGFLVARDVYTVDLVSDPSLTLFLLWTIEFQIVAIVYSFLQKPSQNFPVSAFMNALGAIALGAPIGMQYLPKTIHWSFLMSVLTFVPAAAVFGASWTDWHRVFASIKPSGNIEYMIVIPAYGAIIGGWFGAWPMPLDWERPWQEWPICVCYGGIGGFVIGQFCSLSLMCSFRNEETQEFEASLGRLTLGEPPIDLMTDTYPEGLTAAYEQCASDLSARLVASLAWWRDYVLIPELLLIFLPVRIIWFYSFSEKGIAEGKRDP
ncbi:unnamed protein product [Cochlearia groenlandica]